MLGFALPVGAFARFMAVAAGWISSGKRTLPLVLDVDQTLVDAMPHRVTGEPGLPATPPARHTAGSNAMAQCTACSARVACKQHACPRLVSIRCY